MLPLPEYLSEEICAEPGETFQQFLTRMHAFLREMQTQLLSDATPLPFKKRTLLQELMDLSASVQSDYGLPLGEAHKRSDSELAEARRAEGIRKRGGFSIGAHRPQMRRTKPAPYATWIRSR